VGAHIRSLPPYSPDLNPIENLCATLKALLRKAAPRTVDALWADLGLLLDRFTPAECTRYFASSGYVKTEIKNALVHVSTSRRFHSFGGEQHRNKEDGCGKKDDRRARRHVPRSRNQHSRYGRRDADDDGI